MDDAGDGKGQSRVKLGLDPGLDGGTDGVDGEERDDGKGKTKEEVGAGVSQIDAGVLDTHLRDGSRLPEGNDLMVLVVTTDAAPFVRRVDDGVLKANVQSMQ